MLIITWCTPSIIPFVNMPVLQNTDCSVTTHFKLSEFYNTNHVDLRSANRNCFFFNAQFIVRATLIAVMLEKIRLFFGHPIRITSGYRFTDLNKSVGGAVNSDHILMKAVDIAPFDADILDLVQAVKMFSELHPTHIRYKEIHPDYIHLSFNII